MNREVESSKKNNIHCIGSNHPNGTYCLRILLEAKVELVFGRFKKGKTIKLEKGEYLYIGSALSIRGSTTLGNRLRRHTSRSVENRSHKIQKELFEFFTNVGITYTLTLSPKTLFWNIDHLLNLSQAEITEIILIRDPKALENPWSEYLENLRETSIIEKGLGANDSKGHTHIQFSKITNNHWKHLPYELPT